MIHSFRYFSDNKYNMIKDNEVKVRSDVNSSIKISWNWTKVNGNVKKWLDDVTERNINVNLAMFKCVSFENGACFRFSKKYLRFIFSEHTNIVSNRVYTFRYVVIILKCRRSLWRHNYFDAILMNLIFHQKRSHVNVYSHCHFLGRQGDEDACIGNWLKYILWIECVKKYDS